MYIFTRQTLEARRNRLGERPYLFEIDAAEAWDIDEELDFLMAEFLYAAQKEVNQMTAFNVLLTAPYMIPTAERFRPVLDHYGMELIVPDVHERLSEEEILAYAGQFDGAICGDDRYTERVLKACLPRLKVISKWGTGIDSIDKAAATRLGIQVCNTPNAFTLPVADTVLGYMLAFARRLPWMDAGVKAGIWEKIPGRSLSECTLGVIGVGNMGKAVLRRARAFGMKLLANDIIPIAPDFIVENGVEMTSLQRPAGAGRFCQPELRPEPDQPPPDQYRNAELDEDQTRC